MSMFQSPVFVELLGTAHSETIKPAVLEPKHLTQFRVHIERGLSLFPPEQLNEMLATGKLSLDSNNTLMNTLVRTFYVQFVFRLFLLSVCCHANTLFSSRLLLCQYYSYLCREYKNLLPSTPTCLTLTTLFAPKFSFRKILFVICTLGCILKVAFQVQVKTFKINFEFLPPIC